MLVVSNPDVVVEALVVNLAAIPAFQVNVLPFAIVATNTSPKLLNDQSPGSSVILLYYVALDVPVSLGRDPYLGVAQVMRKFVLCLDLYYLP